MLRTVQEKGQMNKRSDGLKNNEYEKDRLMKYIERLY